MKNKQVLLIAVMLCSVLFATELFGQQVRVTPTVELSTAISLGNVTLSASGAGASSGFGTVKGTLKNNMSVEISINVEIKGGLYLRNGGTGQNMLATQVYLSNGGYYDNGINKFITLSAGASVGISFDAYCADFDLDNPTESEIFSFSPVPKVLLSISQKISRYQADHFDLDLIVPIQLALWRSQGKTQSEIGLKFDFSLADWIQSTAIMNY